MSYMIRLPPPTLRVPPLEGQKVPGHSHYSPFEVLCNSALHPENDSTVLVGASWALVLW